MASVRHDTTVNDLAEVRPLSVCESENTILRSLSTSGDSLRRCDRELVESSVGMALGTVLGEESLHVGAGAVDVELAREWLACLVLGFRGVSDLYRTEKRCLGLDLTYA